MGVVDELAAVLVELSVGERAAAGPAAPAESIGGLEDLGDVAGLPQPVGTRQPGEAGADDDHPACAAAADAICRVGMLETEGGADRRAC